VALWINVSLLHSSQELFTIRQTLLIISTFVKFESDLKFSAMKFHPGTTHFVLFAAKNGDDGLDPFISASSGSSGARKEPAEPLAKAASRRKTPAKFLAPLSAVTPATPGAAKSDGSTDSDSPASVEHVMTMSSAGKPEPEVQVVQLQQPSKSRKPRDTLLREQFNELPGTKPGTIKFECAHGCGYARSWQRWNAFYARNHSLECDKVPQRTKLLLSQNTQRARQERRIATMSSSSGSSAARESFGSICESASASFAARNSKRKRQMNFDLTSALEVATLTKKDAEKILKGEVEVTLQRKEPLSRLLDPAFQANLINRYPNIGKYLPSSVHTIYANYVEEIDRETLNEIVQLMLREPGLINVAFDGVTVNGKHKTIYCASIGGFTMFFKWTDLKSNDHVSAEEVKSSVEICNQIKALLDNREIASLPVDNASRYVANETAVSLVIAGGYGPIVLRDPAHCVDLPAKDMAGLSFVKEGVDWCSEIYKFLSKHRVGAIKNDMILMDVIGPSEAAKNCSETRMNDLHIVFDSTIAQRECLSVMQNSDTFQEYYRSRPASQKAKLDELFDSCTRIQWAKIEALKKLTAPFADAHMMCSQRDMPISTLLPLTQALYNEVHSQLGAEFDQIFGAGSSKEVRDLLAPRFNFNGEHVPGSRKSPILDPAHLTAFYVDPFNWELRNEIKVMRTVKTVIGETVEKIFGYSAENSYFHRMKAVKEFEVCML